MMASEAFHAIPELALKVIHDKTIVTPLVLLPLLCACDLLRKLLQFGLPFWRGRLIWRLGKDPIEIFVETIKKEGQKFL